MKKTWFFAGGTHSWKLNLTEKYWVGYGNKWGCPLWSKDSKIGSTVSQEEIYGINC